MTERFRCIRCGGTGYIEDNDHGHYTRDVCMHCDGTGCVSYSVAQADRFTALCETIAYQTIMRYKENADNDPEGEGWAFAAAENMMHEHDYTQARIWDETGRVENQLRGLDESTLRTMCDMANIDMPPCVDDNGELVEDEQPKSVVIPMSGDPDDEVPF